MAGTRQILQRRSAAQNISKVTGTMETISSVRYRQFFRNWVGGLDFYNALAQLAYLVVTSDRPIEHPLMGTNESTTQAILVTGSNRGLCGAFNTNLFKLVEVHTKMAQRFGRDLKIYTHGRRITHILRQRGVNIERELDQFEEVPSPDQLKELADQFTEQFLTGQISRLSIVYTRFFSPASQKAQTLAILPMAELIDDLTTRATVMWPWDLTFEDFILSPSVEEIFDGLATLMVQTAIQGCFLEGALSEHLGRVISMRNATDNAEEMIENLTKEYNRARQSQITTEMLDIVGGALAVTK
ncbi:MAG: ATP synthase F1 subunit gamma [Sedimentisphaerales bacterium]|nr:ATP synthase F1 subunit gamma [Sedimentisphaerales bacterium]